MGISSPLSPWEFWGLNSGHQAYQQAPFPAEPFFLTLLYIIKSSEMKDKFILSFPCLVLLEYRASLMTRAFPVFRYYLPNYLSQLLLNFYHEGTLNFTKCLF